MALTRSVKEKIRYAASLARVRSFSANETHGQTKRTPVSRAKVVGGGKSCPLLASHYATESSQIATLRTRGIFEGWNQTIQRKHQCEHADDKVLEGVLVGESVQQPSAKPELVQ
jgi:hypothetical protein